ncbi:hypothetical protein TNCV_2382011 [Trichonephila clavipes]|nr:hypothetical protein TNCV_2382011 [Trichonephila clavipes]
MPYPKESPIYPIFVANCCVVTLSARVERSTFLPRYEPFNVCAIFPLEACRLGKNCFLLEHRILGLA